MNHPNERRRLNRRQAREVLSPELIAGLVLCGGEVRGSDRTVGDGDGAATDAKTAARHDRRRRAGSVPFDR